MTTDDPDRPERREWERPGAHPVAPGVHRIPLPLPQDTLRAVNVYALTGDEGLTLVDAGWALEESRTALEEALAGLGHDLSDIRRFLVTHAHRDHYTQAVAIRRVLGTRVAIGADERANLDQVHAQAGRPGLTPLMARLVAHGAADLVERLTATRSESTDTALWQAPDEWLQAGDTVTAGARSLTVVPTPGHTRGHVVLHDVAGGLLFAGDHVLPHITPSIGFEAAPGASPLSAYLSSLELMLALPDALLLPAHGPVRPSVHDRVGELLDHHRERLADTLAVVRSGRSTGYQVAEGLRWTRHRWPFEELDLFGQLLATNETIAHLLVLAERGQVVAHEQDGQAWFGL